MCFYLKNDKLKNIKNNELNCFVLDRKSIDTFETMVSSFIIVLN